ncbi:MAG: DUF438 domain-containing protein [Acholeplasmataceae bacterium]|nr:DUF438 domain-containing protein [Acholeplasmataceae bacterium]
MSELINNSEFRQKKLKELIKSLHEGKTVDEVKSEFQKHFADVSTSEISQIEQALIKEGLAVEEVQRLCDVHATVFKGSISDIHSTKDYSKIPGHPVNVFIEENKAIEELINEDIFPNLRSLEEKIDHNKYLLVRIGFDRLQEIERHYSRKEYLFFPYLEKHNITAPPKVMWGVDDEIRADIKAVIAMLNSTGVNIIQLKEQAEVVLQKVLDMVFKENNILIPLMAETFSLYEWIKIDEATPEFGYTLVKPTRSWKVEPEETSQEDKVVSEEIPFDAGSLTSEEANAIFNTLPFDLTFVDKDDKVKYFTQGKERIFSRPKTIIGREVSLCHPPASVKIVEGIINSFKAGEKEHEDFWIRLENLFIHIRYFAVRDRNGNYLGTLEVTQNIKPITELEGEKRLVSDK